ncbi:MAG: nucleoside triphosphate pyrophosphatase YhdE [Acidimicrobiia bacterium]|nr:MAG: nucleoside triphosphate pyrophosphatase YhdE [Acidimicrobiia bacterium]
MPDLVLASSSPRRALLLSAAGYSITRRIPQIDETALPDEAPEQTVIRLAREKALSPGEEDALVLGADTAVVLDGEAFGKPIDRNHAIEMLQRLAGRTHAVVTGWALAIGGAIVEDGFEVTLVTMRNISDEEAAAYVDTGEPLGKAGAYAIQGEGERFVTGMVGTRSNVIGLPLTAVVPALERAGLDRKTV